METTTETTEMGEGVIDYDEDVLAFLRETFDLDLINEYLHDEGFSTASEEDLDYLQVNPLIFQRREYKENLPFYEGEYWHTIVGTYFTNGNNVFRFNTGTIMRGIQIPVKYQGGDMFLDTFILESQLIALQLGSLKPDGAPTYCSMRARIVRFREENIFLIRSTELMALLAQAKSISKEMIGRFHRYYLTSTFYFRYGARATIQRIQIDDITELCSKTTIQLEDEVLKDLDLIN